MDTYSEQLVLVDDTVWTEHSINNSNKLYGGIDVDFNPTTSTPPDASGGNAIAIGGGALAVGSDTIAIGNAEASQQYGIAIGEDALASQQNATAVGESARAQMEGATAIGKNATAAFSRSTALGDGATAQTHDEVRLGSATSVATVHPDISSANPQPNQLYYI